MSTIYHVGFEQEAKKVYLAASQNALPEDAEYLGSFTDQDGDNLVIFHYVRDLLYKRGSTNQGLDYKDQILDLSFYKIEMYEPDVIEINFISFASNDPLEISETASVNVPIFYNPENATNKDLTVTFSPTGIATAEVAPIQPGFMSRIVVVTGEAVGTTTMTVTTVQGAKSVSKEVTVTSMG